MGQEKQDDSRPHGAETLRGIRGKKRAGAGQRTRMISSTALHVRTSGHQLLVFMKPFLEQQGIFWLPPAGAEPQQASTGAPYSRARAQAAGWRQGNLTGKQASQAVGPARLQLGSQLVSWAHPHRGQHGDHVAGGGEQPEERGEGMVRLSEGEAAWPGQAWTPAPQARPEVALEGARQKPGDGSEGPPVGRKS